MVQISHGTAQQQDTAVQSDTQRPLPRGKTRELKVGPEIGTRFDDLVRIHIYIYMYVYVCMHACMYVCKYIYIRIDIYIYLYTYYI